MSKSDFSRVKYPKKDEIHNQINAIIEQSHMFEVEQSQSGYVECKRVKKSFFSSNAATAAIAVAACVIMVLCVAPFVGDGIRKSKAHTNVTENESDSSVINGTQAYVSDENHIEFGLTKSAKGGGSLYPVMFFYETPIVKVNGGTNYAIAGVYNTKMNGLWKELENKYVEQQTSGATTAYKDVNLEHTIKYIATKKTDIIGLLSTYKLTENMNSEDDYDKKQRIYVECDTFESKTGDVVDKSEIFKDYGQALDIMVEFVYKQIQEEINVGIEGINNEYKTLVGVRNALKNNSTWRLADNGITIYCNDYRTYEEQEFAANSKIITTTYEAFVITYDKCDIIKDEYKR